MTINDFVPYLVVLVVLILLVKPVLSGTTSLGGRHGTSPITYSRDNPNEAPMYYFLTGVGLLYASFLLWGIFGDHHSVSQHQGPKPVFINELTDSPITSAASNSASGTAQARHKNATHKNTKHTHHSK